MPPPVDVPKTRHALRVGRLDQLPIDRHHIVHGCRVRRVRRHAVIDGDDAKAAVSRHHDRLARACLAWAEHVAATMDMKQHATQVGGRHHTGLDDVRLHAGDRDRLGDDPELFPHCGQGREHRGGSLVDEVLPLRRVLWVCVPVGHVGPCDDRLLLRADTLLRHRQSMCRHLARTGLPVRFGLRAGQIVPGFAARLLCHGRRGQGDEQRRCQ